MRNLRRYICEGKNRSDAFRTETDVLLNTLARFRKKTSVIVGNLHNPLYTKVVRDGYMHALKWEIKLPENITQMMEAYMLQADMPKGNVLKNLLEGRVMLEDPLVYMFDIIEKAQYPDRRINGILFMRLSECDWMVRLRNIEVKMEYRYWIKYGKPERDFMYTIKHGTVQYHGEIMRVGRTLLSLSYHQDFPLLINKCRLYYKTREGQIFGYHICTNTMHTTSHECGTTNIECECARMTELWCLRYQLIRKMQSLITRVKQGNYEFGGIPNFL